MGSRPVLSKGVLVFSIVYFTFFLDNVLLTVLVPIIPDWVSGGAALSLWAKHDAPLASMLNGTLAIPTHHRDQPGSSGGQAVVGVVLGAKAAAQLALAGPSAGQVATRGPATVLKAATLALLAAALAFYVCSSVRGWRAALLVGLGRVAHGAGAAAANVAGMALVTTTIDEAHRQRALGALLGAVALGVLVGYPFGGLADALWSKGAPFLLLAVAFYVDFALQWLCLETDPTPSPPASARPVSWLGACGVRVARSGLGGACAGAVLVTTSVMATLEPCLPPWIAQKFHPQRWAAGAVFVPDSLGYLVSTSVLGGAGAAERVAEHVALAGCVGVGLAALTVPLAQSMRALAAPHLLLGVSLGATDAALLPALLTRHARHVAPAAALLQASASAAYALGPALGGLASWALGFETTMRTLGVINLLYAAHLYRALRQYPLSEKWGAVSASDDDEDSPSDEDGVAVSLALAHTPNALSHSNTTPVTTQATDERAPLAGGIENKIRYNTTIY